MQSLFWFQKCKLKIETAELHVGFVFGNLSTHYAGNISDVTLSRLPRLSARLVTVFLFDDVELHILWVFYFGLCSV